MLRPLPALSPRRFRPPLPLPLTRMETKEPRHATMTETSKNEQEVKTAERQTAAATEEKEEEEEDKEEEEEEEEEEDEEEEKEEEEEEEQQ